MKNKLFKNLFNHSNSSLNSNDEILSNEDYIDDDSYIDDILNSEEAIRVGLFAQHCKTQFDP